MIKLFNTTDNLFRSNGDKIITPLRAIIHNEDNGSFYLDLEASLKYIDDLTPNRILVANTPRGYQAFRISNVTKTRKRISLRAKHISYDSENYLILDSYVVDKDANAALEHLNNATDNISPFTLTSNITKIASYRCVRRSLFEALQGVIERWGGHLYRDNYNVQILDSIGTDNGIEIRYGKNLQEINATYNWDNVVTKINPVGRDGLLLPEVYLYSDVQYDIPYTKKISFDQSEVLEEDYEDEDGNLNEEAYQNALIEDLRKQATDYLNANCYPSVNYTLSANLQGISNIGDTILVKDEKLDINLLTNVISYEYDCILEEYTSLEFGNFKPELSKLMSTISDNTATAISENNAVIQVTLNKELSEATDRIWSALGSSYVIYDGDKILVLDRLPKEAAQNVIMINSGGIGFSNEGINGTFKSAWTIDNILNMENINVIGLSANLIRSGTLRLGSNLNQYGQLEVYDESNTLIAQLNKDGLKMFGVDGSYVLMNTEVGFAGYDRLNNKIYWVSGDSFHQKKSEIEEEVTFFGILRAIPITIEENGEVVNSGVGFVSVLGGGN